MLFSTVSMALRSTGSIGVGVTILLPRESTWLYLVKTSESSFLKTFVIDINLLSISAKVSRKFVA